MAPGALAALHRSAKIHPIVKRSAISKPALGRTSLSARGVVPEAARMSPSNQNNVNPESSEPVRV